MLYSPHMGKPELEVGRAMALELGPKQNLCDQSPIDHLITASGVPKDFFIRGGDRLEKLATFTRALVFEKTNWTNAWGLPPLTHLAPFVDKKYHKSTMLNIYQQKGLAFLESFEYLIQYLEEYWLRGGKQYNTQGYPIQHPATKIVIPRYTFAAYQSQKRGDPSFGLNDEFPGLETADSLKEKLSRMKQTGVNKKFRVLRSFTGNQE